MAFTAGSSRTPGRLPTASTLSTVQCPRSCAAGWSGWRCTPPDPARLAGECAQILRMPAGPAEGHCSGPRSATQRSRRPPRSPRRRSSLRRPPDRLAPSSTPAGLGRRPPRHVAEFHHEQGMASGPPDEQPTQKHRPHQGQAGLRTARVVRSLRPGLQTVEPHHPRTTSPAATSKPMAEPDTSGAA